MVLRRIGPLSAMKVAAFVYAGIGFIVGCFIALISMVGGLAGAFNEGINAGLPSALFGVGAIVLFPILYGIAGAIGALIMTSIYNLVAGIVGGVDLDLQ